MKLLMCHLWVLSLMLSAHSFADNSKLVEFASVIQPDPACSNAVVAFHLKADDALVYAVQSGHSGYVSYRLLNLETAPQLAVATRVNFNQDQMLSTSTLTPRGLTLFNDDHTLLLVSMRRARTRAPHTPFITAFRAGLDGSVVSHVGDLPNFVGDNDSILGIVNLSPHQNLLFLANQKPKPQDGKYVRITTMGLQPAKVYETKSQHAYALEPGCNELSGIVMLDELGNGISLENNHLFQVAVRGPSIHAVPSLRGTHPSVQKIRLFDFGAEPHAAGVKYQAINRGPIFQERETIMLVGVDQAGNPVFHLYYLDLYPADGG